MINYTQINKLKEMRPYMIAQVSGGWSINKEIYIYIYVEYS